MFGASIVRAKRERERKERLARGEDPPIIPYIKPFGPRFDASQLPYFKYRQAVATLGQVREYMMYLHQKEDYKLKTLISNSYSLNYPHL